MRPEILKPLIKGIEKIWKIDLGGEENLAAAREHLFQGPLMIIFNHSFSGDVFCGGAVCLEKLQPHVKRLLIPASQKHLDLKRGLVRDSLAIRLITQLINAELIPIVQSYDTKTYGERMALGSWRRMLARFQEIGSTPGVVILHSPEGHRSDDGQLQRAKRGVVDLLERLGNNCLVLPLGIVVDSQNRGLNFFKKVQIKVGRPFTLNDLTETQKRPLPKPEKIKIADRIMKDHLAPLLPENLHGVYRDFPS